MIEDCIILLFFLYLELFYILLIDSFYYFPILSFLHFQSKNLQSYTPVLLYSCTPPVLLPYYTTILSLFPLSDLYLFLFFVLSSRRTCLLIYCLHLVYLVLSLFDSCYILSDGYYYPIAIHSIITLCPIPCILYYRHIIYHIFISHYLSSII